MKTLTSLTLKLRKGKDSVYNPKGYIRNFFKNNLYWSAIEEALVQEMCSKEKDKSRSALIRRAIHERAKRTLGNKYEKIIANPTGFFKY